MTLRGTLILGRDPEPVTIDGRGLITLDAGGSGRVVRILEGTTATLAGLSIRGGQLASFGGGGGVFNDGELTLVDSTVSGNSASFGAGLFNYGSLTLIRSTITGNTAEDPDGFFGGNGGGVTNYYGELMLVDSVVSGNRAGFAGGVQNNAGTLTLLRTVVRENVAAEGGGGVSSWGGSSAIIDSTISGNSARTGGGIVGSNLTIRGTTIEGNAAADDGGGLSVGGGTTLVDSTVVDNTAGRDGGGLSSSYGRMALVNSTVGGNSAGQNGGGISNAGSLVLIHATLTANRAGSGTGGGLYTSPPSYSYYSNQPGGTSRLVNTIVSGDTRGEDGTPDNLGGAAPTPGSAGNLVGSGEVSLDPAFNLVGIDDPRLGPLADNGGPTPTHALLPDSPAIDLGIYLIDPTTDQRGVSRLQGITPDAGAFEFEAAPPRAPEASSLIVSTLEDVVDPYDDLTSLREALAFAALRAGDDAVTFDPSLSGTIVVRPEPYGDLTLADGSGSVTIDGRGVITLDARGAGRVLAIEAGTTATLVGLTITGGRLEGNRQRGGGILNLGVLTLADSVVRDNSAPFGGGLFNDGGSLTLVRSVVSGNVAQFNGGGAVNSRGEMTVIDSTIRDNEAGAANPYGSAGYGGACWMKVGR
ncbi:choice-of-anchor Q domain-containing protein [Tautonia plasticadhaerens]|uniref:Uncharacterized protein n=1 Tax=Tautonia plasticadhaerens TaxID=2527974 RepID=A0A518H6G8_9BACT|nr:choice-of-anchor Q domain-containing protein [Tautonia plasticadhaerens]QDV36433.1 hypothetical protein ElP_43570 [Tautonia plasticadhaerens]